MVRKRNLSDLLRDEAGSLDDSETDPPAAEQTIDVSAVAEVAEPAESAATEAGAIESARRPHPPTKADLQTLVTELKTELEAGRDREQQLDRKIAELQAEAESRQAQIEQLQRQLQQQGDRSAELAQVQQQLDAEQAQTAQLKTELEEARQLILKLSEANSKPEIKTSETKTSETKTPEAKTPDRPVPQRAPLQAKPLPQRGGAIAPALRADAQRQAIAPARPPAPPARPAVQPRPYVPTRPIAPNTVPMMPSESDTRLSDADIGWVD